MACLAGDGVGPELMAETSRVFAEVARLHAFHLDDVHLPFGGEALTRYGHPLPQSTREAYCRADAIFVSSPDDPAFDGVKADLDLGWRVSRVHFGAEADRWDGLEVEYLTLGGVLTRFRDHPGTVDLVVAGSHLAGAIVDAAAHLAGSLHTVARAWLSANGPGVFAAEVCEADEVAGFGVADPAGTLLAASLLLGEGLGARSAARTLERAVAAAEEATVFDTRSFTDAVITNLPAVRTDTEHFQEVQQ